MYQNNKIDLAKCQQKNVYNKYINVNISHTKKKIKKLENSKVLYHIFSAWKFIIFLNLNFLNFEN